MNAAGLFGKSDVETVIDENARRAVHVARLPRNAAQCFARERRTISPGQIFLTKLNPIDASGGHQFDPLQKQLKRIVLGCGLQTAAVGDVTEDRLSVPTRPGIERRTISEGHWMDRDANR